MTNQPDTTKPMTDEMLSAIGDAAKAIRARGFILTTDGFQLSKLTISCVTEIERLKEALQQEKGVCGLLKVAGEHDQTELERLRMENQELRKDRLDMHHLIVCVEDHIDSFNMLKPVIEAIRTKMQSELPTLKDVQKNYRQSKVTTETKG